MRGVSQYEREQPQCLVKSLSRRRRIARGSGRTEVDVSNMLASFANMQSKVRDLSKLMKMSGVNGAPHFDPSTCVASLLLQHRLLRITLRPFAKMVYREVTLLKLWICWRRCLCAHEGQSD